MSTTVCEKLPAPRPRTAWIISPISDWLFFLGTPLLGIAFAFALLNAQWDLTTLLLVLSALAAGHHLPGYLRTYGDPELFRQYRGRLLLGPPLIFAGAYWFELNGAEGFRVAVFVWSVWHTVMQYYGIMRIYDSKTGEVSWATARLDWLAILLWIVAIDLNNEGFAYDFHEYLYKLGVPYASYQTVQWLAKTSLVCATVVTGAYVFYTASLWFRRRPLNPLKLVLLFNTVLFFYVAFSLTNNILLVGVVSEILHDIQYYAIAWTFQRRLVDKRKDVSTVMRLLFRPSVTMVAVYLALCAGYGVLFTDVSREIVNRPAFTTFITAALITSTLFHFYIDGFIWKVRQAQTQQYLGIQESTQAPGVLPLGPLVPRPRTVVHLVLYAVVVSTLWGSHLLASRPTLETQKLLAEHYPNVGKGHVQLGNAYRELGRFEEAIGEYRAALAVDRHTKTETEQYLANLLLRQEDFAEAITVLRSALARAPHHKRPAIAGQLALLLVRCPKQELRDDAEALKLAKFACTQRGPALPMLLQTLAISYEAAGQLPEAVATARQALHEAKAYKLDSLARTLEGRIARYEQTQSWMHAVGE